MKLIEVMYKLILNPSLKASRTDWLFEDYIRVSDGKVINDFGMGQIFRPLELIDNKWFIIRGQNDW